MDIRCNVLKLCLITNISHSPLPDYGRFLEHAVRGGVTMVQLREKSDNMGEVHRRALALKKTLRPLGIPLIINDFVELAADIDADGVHIGPNDMPILQARKLLGTDKIIGLSIESMEELNVINSLIGSYYVTASAVFFSKSKPDCKKLWGIHGVEELVSQSRHPVTCIGGINTRNAGKLIDIGASGIAVVGAIHDSPDPYKAAQTLRQAMDKKAIEERE